MSLIRHWVSCQHWLTFQHWVALPTLGLAVASNLPIYSISKSRATAPLWIPMSSNTGQYQPNTANTGNANPLSIDQYWQSWRVIMTHSPMFANLRLTDCMYTLYTANVGKCINATHEFIDQIGMIDQYW